MVTIKRFEPQCGLEKAALEEEAQALSREIECQLLRPISEVRIQLGQRGAAWNHADEALHAVVLSLPERERAMVQSLLLGDLLRIQEVYLECLRMRQPEPAAPPPRPPSEVEKVDFPSASEVFNELLFPT